MSSSLHDVFIQRLRASVAAVSSLQAPEQLSRIVAIAHALRECLARGGTVYTCGNGGSAAEAMHLAEELIGRYRGNRSPHRAICLNADPTALTCIANDFGFESVFARQCEALAQPGDLLVVFSTSGNSENIVQALQAAQRRGAVTVGLLGRNGGRCEPLVNHPLVVASDDAAHIQESHQVALHLLCEAIETMPV
jgi:D-sedoheptulose 7-phosphate isomerase